ncbi:helix-turn-helix domain-containing protein [Pelomonas sp. V22]|uniref:helix-turn-helix transcriptional regulator n=1 Tax=Pelomonas sp. V22 TaxID=2822139 RepID=UPI0024A7AFE4|nr:helix-turn-helix domain-containing protein [Pelomonas sp. V22]MDI4632423.1 helix-turn-helix domain-containing protein [Pelomonas sp. V22]
MSSNIQPRARTEQPLHAAQISDALLNLRTVQALSGLGKTSIYERIKAGELKPVKLGARATRFRAGEVQAWLQAQGK